MKREAMARSASWVVTQPAARASAAKAEITLLEDMMRLP